MTEFSPNPTKEQEIEKYTIQVKHGMHPNTLVEILLNEISILISKQNGEPENDIKEQIYRKAGEKIVSEITYNCY